MAITTTTSDEKEDDVGNSFTTAPPVRTAPLPGALMDEDVGPVYARKARALNAAIQDIGMGKYQWALFCVAGFGWCADNLWPQTTAIILPQVVRELGPPRREYLLLAQNSLMVGAAGWGIGSDLIGRRWAFNLTLLIAGVFGTAAGGAPGFAALATLAALWSVGVGGNLPVDSAVFLEFLPGSHQYLLTVMSVWWSLGQIIVSAVAWPLMTSFSCSSDGPCEKADNMGWRYLLFAMGGFTLAMFALRFFVFKMYESPKYLMGQGDDAGAASVVGKLAKYNGVESSFSIGDLKELDGQAGEEENKTGAAATVQRKLKVFNATHVKALFRTRSMAKSTSAIIVLWFLIGLAFPLYNAFLPFLLSRRGAEMGTDISTTFRNYLIIGVMNVPGSLLGGLAVELPGVGRKGAMSFATVLKGVLLFASTTAGSANALLGWNCGYAVTSNMMYGVLYAYTPEVFPTRDRGTGNGLAATANRVGGILAPVVAMYANLETAVPVYVSGALFLASGLVMLVLPFEVRGKSSL